MDSGKQRALLVDKWKIFDVQVFFSQWLTEVVYCSTGQHCLSQQWPYPRRTVGSALSVNRAGPFKVQIFYRDTDG